MMNDDEKLAAFERRAQQLLRAGAERLDGPTRSKLTQARHAALESARGRGWVSFVGWKTWLMPLGSVAGAAALAVLLHFHHGNGVTAQASLEDLEVVAAGESLEMMEDLDFYEWLDTQQGADGAKEVS